MLNFLKNVLHIGTKVVDGSVGDGVSREKKNEITKKGKALENAIAIEFENLGFKIVRNIYLPLKIKDEYTEIDLIAVGSQGIFVIESKNYNAKIIGTFHDTHWKAEYKNSSYKLYSPVRQNTGHINNLLRVIPEFKSLPIYSYVVFPNTAILQVDLGAVKNNPIKVMNIKEIKYNVNRLRGKISYMQCKTIVRALSKYNNVSFIKEIKQKRTVNKYKKRW